MKNQLKLKQGAWYGDRYWSLKFPEHWIINVFSHKETKALNENEIIKKINTPIGSDDFVTLLRPGKRVLIICDDLSRPTRTDLILPLLINMLEKQRIERTGISILLATGTHRPMNREEIELKLGKGIAERYRVYSHNFRSKGVFMGRTSRGTPVYVNKQVARHDLILGVGGIYPHSTAGFSGGAKLILGISSIRTILHFHMRREGAPTGGRTDNEFRSDVLEAARLAGMNFIVNSMINQDREITEVVSGDVEKAFIRGVELARTTYGVPKPDAAEFDLVIADTYPFDASYAFTRKGWWPVRNISQDCYKLIISSMHEGKGSHLVYPIPNDKKINKLRRLYFEWLSFGAGHFFSITVVSRLQSIFSRFRRRRSTFKRDPDSKTPSKFVESGFPGSDVDILHHATGDPEKSLGKLPNKLFGDPDHYIRYIVEKTGNKPVKVALYQASSLTYPL